MHDAAAMRATSYNSTRLAGLLVSLFVLLVLHAAPSAFARPDRTLQQAAHVLPGGNAGQRAQPRDTRTSATAPVPGPAVVVQQHRVAAAAHTPEPQSHAAAVTDDLSSGRGPARSLLQPVAAAVARARRGDARFQTARPPAGCPAPGAQLSAAGCPCTVHYGRPGAAGRGNGSNMLQELCPAGYRCRCV